MIRLEIPTSAGKYPVLIGPGLSQELGAHLAAAGVGGRIALVADRRVYELHGARIAAALGEHRLCLVPEGEQAKSLEQAARLWDWLAAERFTRSDCLVAFGGGVTGDLAGFAAATFHRGMPFVQLPTTLLAQVDSSVGGKVAIDRPLGKNLVGAFHQPSLVLADTTLLTTLAPRQRWEGLAEIVKAALIADAGFLAELEESLEALGEGSASAAQLEGAIAAAVRIKAEVVSQDERETGLRRILNFGHTVGHALEAASAYSGISHGEAVLLGMFGALHLSRRLGLLEEEELERGRALLSRFPLPAPLDVSEEELLRAIYRDKKVHEGELLYVLLASLGKAQVQPVGEALLREAIAASLAPLAARQP